MSMLTLKSIFKKYNKVFFGGKLKISAIHFAKLSKKTAHAETAWFDNCPPILEIGQHLKSSGRFVRIVLLHEMLHVSLPKDISHGLAFVNARKKLIRLGAYNDLL